MTIVVTGGAGFAGSHLVDEMCRAFPEEAIIVIDKMTYAGDVRNISEHIMSNRVRLMVGDVADLDFCRRAIGQARLVIHAAAESHVDNSFGNSLEFTRTNVLGTHCILEACRIAHVPRVVHISTDEVYGEVMEGAVDEEAILKPHQPVLCLQSRRRDGCARLPAVLPRANSDGTRQQFVRNTAVS